MNISYQKCYYNWCRQIYPLSGLITSSQAFLTSDSPIYLLHKHRVGLLQEFHLQDVQIVLDPMPGSGIALKQVNLQEVESRMVVFKGLNRREDAWFGQLGLSNLCSVA